MEPDFAVCLLFRHESASMLIIHNKIVHNSAQDSAGRIVDRDIEVHATHRKNAGQNQ
jgi:hypothetical protein